MNFFQVRRCQESGSVLCIQGPFMKRLMLARVFPLCARVISRTGQSFLSPLSLSNQTEHCQFCGRNTRLKEKKNAFARQLRMGFPVSVVVFLLHPAFTCESIRPPTLTLKAATGRRLRRRVFTFITVLFITAVLRSCGANVLYIQMKRVTPV